MSEKADRAARLLTNTFEVGDRVRSRTGGRTPGVVESAEDVDGDVRMHRVRWQWPDGVYTESWWLADELEWA